MLKVLPAVVVAGELIRGLARAIREVKRTTPAAAPPADAAAGPEEARRARGGGARGGAVVLLFRVRRARGIEGQSPDQAVAVVAMRGRTL